MERQPTNLSGLAARLRLPRRWLREQAQAGNIPCLKLLFSVSAVRAALERMAAPSEVTAHAQ